MTSGDLSPEGGKKGHAAIWGIVVFILLFLAGLAWWGGWFDAAPTAASTDAQSLEVRLEENLNLYSALEVEVDEEGYLRYSPNAQRKFARFIKWGDAYDPHSNARAAAQKAKAECDDADGYNGVYAMYITGAAGSLLKKLYLNAASLGQAPRQSDFVDEIRRLLCDWAPCPKWHTEALIALRKKFRKELLGVPDAAFDCGK